jgi:diguanylate cyclase (GGDEF)-like protein/PAS domain S-box-containing protein
MGKILFFRRIGVRLFSAFLLLMLAGAIIAGTLNIQIARKGVNDLLLDQFSSTLAITQNFLDFLGQTALIWTKHVASEKEVVELATLDSAVDDALQKFLDERADATAADALMIIDVNGDVIASHPSTLHAGDNLGSWPIVRDALTAQQPGPMVNSEKNNFVLYASSPIASQRDGKIIGAMLLGYALNNTFTQRIRRNTDIEIAIIRDRGVMASTFQDGSLPIEELPIPYMDHLQLLKDPDQILTANFNGAKYYWSARTLKHLSSSIPGSLLLAYPTARFEGVEQEIMLKVVLMFSGGFFLLVLIAIKYSSGMNRAINKLTGMADRLSMGQLQSRIEMATGDEFELLANNFNRMADAIEQANSELQDHSRNLEQTVLERTQHLFRAQERYRALIESTKDFVWEVDLNGAFTFVSTKVKDVLGLDPDPILGKHHWDLAAQGRSEEIRKALESIIAGHESFDGLEILLQHRNGDAKVIESSGVPILSEQGILEGYRGIGRDITERKRAQQAIADERAFLQSVIDGVMDPIKVIASDYTLLLMNQAAKNQIPITTDSNNDHCYCYQISICQSRPSTESKYPCPMQGVIETGKPVKITHDYLNDSGEDRIYELVATPLWNRDGKLTAIIEASRDITERVLIERQLRKNESRLDHLAHHDPLTNLPNRALFKDRLHHAIKKAHRDSQELAVLFIDLDRFKQINDSLGHQIGDQVLQEVSQRLVNAVREDDTVARLGGDEFVIILENLTQARDAGTLAQKLNRLFEHPFRIAGHELFLSSSIGISLYPQDGQSIDDLTKNADAAMYRVKEEGRNAFQFYTEELTSLAFERVLIESQLRRALEKGEFELYYQPLFDIVNGDYCGAEALIRWNHPDLGTVPPGEFLFTAEDTGLIVPIGEWVLRDACRQAVEWLEQGFSLGRIAVNLSGRQLQNDGVVRFIEEVLQESGCPANLLELEISENFIMNRTEQSIGILEQIKSLGIHLAIDDFGTGYSSLSYLKRLPIERLKIDKSFVRDIPNDPNDCVIAQSIIALAKSMDLVTTAEGVETEEQLDYLRSLGCEDAQGYLFSKPVPAGEFKRFLSTGQAPPSQSGSTV